MIYPLKNNLFCFGFGYCAKATAKLIVGENWSYIGTNRKKEGEGFIFNGLKPMARAKTRLKNITHILISIPPTESVGDPILLYHEKHIAKIETLKWIGYLSTTGVYGDTKGEKVDETAPTQPTSERSQRRLNAELQWREFCKRNCLPLHIFRLPGIYGPGRSVIEKLERGTAQRIIKTNHKFSRIHVDDIALTLLASMKNPTPGEIYNICDDEPAAPEDIVTFSAKLMGINPPPRIPYETAKLNMSPMGRSFWHDNRTVDNHKIKSNLKIKLKHPTYREGLSTIYKK